MGPQTFDPRLSKLEGWLQPTRVCARLFKRERDRRPVSEDLTSRSRDGLLDFWRGYPPCLFCVFRLASDQSSRNVVALAALAFCRALYVQRLAPFIEQLACQWTSRRLGFTALTLLDRPAASSCCWTRSQRSRPTIASCCPGWRSFLCRIAQVDWVGQHVIERSTRE